MHRGLLGQTLDEGAPFSFGHCEDRQNCSSSAAWAVEPGAMRSLHMHFPTPSFCHRGHVAIMCDAITMLYAAFTSRQGSRLFIMNGLLSTLQRESARHDGVSSVKCQESYNWFMPRTLSSWPGTAVLTQKKCIPASQLEILQKSSKFFNMLRSALQFKSFCFGAVKLLDTWRKIVVMSFVM